MASGKVVRGVLFPGNQLFRMEQLAVGPRSHLVDDGRFEIEKYASRDVLTRASFGEERVKRVVATADGFVGRHLPVRVDAMLYI